MPQVVGSAGERRGGQFRAERGLTDGVPDAPVGALAEDAATGAAEQSAVRRGPVLAQVLPEQADQDRRDRDNADSPVGTVLEAARLVRRAGAGPRRAGAWAGAGEDQLALPVRRKNEIRAVQCYSLFRAQRGVVQATEECSQLRAEVGHLAEDRPNLSGAGHGLRIHRCGGYGCRPSCLANWVGLE